MIGIVIYIKAVQAYGKAKRMEMDASSTSPHVSIPPIISIIHRPITGIMFTVDELAKLARYTKSQI